MSVSTLLAGVVLVTMTPIAVVMAAASAANLYLLGDAEPVGSMTVPSPPSVSLPDFDGDKDPGLTIDKNSEGINETDPEKYQQWEYDVSGLNVSVTQFVIWAAPKDFNEDKVVEVGAYLMDCGSSCILLDTATKSISGTTTWTRLELPLTITDRSFENGRRLVIKITVPDSSDDDMWFAYATSNYDAHLVVTSMGPPTTTSTTIATTVPKPTTTTIPKPTTTTTPRPTTTTVLEPFETTSTILPTTTTTANVASIDGDTNPGSVATRQTGTAPDSLSEEPVSDSDTTQPPIRVAQAAGELIALSGGNERVTTELFQNANDLEPEVGLMVVFSTVSETISIYWQAAVALGSVTAILLWVGLWKRESKDEKPRAPSKG